MSAATTPEAAAMRLDFRAADMRLAAYPVGPGPL